MNTQFFKYLTFSFFLLTFSTTGCVSVIKYDDIQPSNLIKPAMANTTSLAAMEEKIYQQVNQYRVSRNLPPLQLDPRISEVCRAHSKAMSEGKVPFSHQGFEQRMKILSQSIPYRSAAENIAYNLGYSEPATQAVQGWIKSPGHRKNMEGNFNLTGVGVVQNAKGEYYFTQIFIRRR
ncbi:MAG: CAP domain-containing protein [Oscillatoriaceae bacterium SKW80]|nr:CAP domain-containing protein [Oscillatoriaceae bacterium SKYG93]MCX8122114.1 CAP domain-containing protein [Oscillatoriaceae bacterium SKW80]MDW8454401.1 CAP domain-containing protein [Oscillatoriaceae cyanobacterium SKYGB_i_bin93]